MKRNPTLKQIAELANVNKSTVSRVLNSPNSINVRKSVRDKIGQIAKNLGYKPNFAAKNLSLQRTSNIAFIAGSSIDLIKRSPYSISVIQGALDEAEKLDFNIIIKFMEFGKVDKFRDFLGEQYGVDGFIFPRTSVNLVMREELVKSPLPTVIVGRVENDMPILKGVGYVQCDEASGMHEGLSYLKAHSHKNIAFLGCSKTNKFQIFLTAVNSIGLKFKKSWGFFAERENFFFQHSQNKIAARKLLEQYEKDKFSSVFVSSDYLSFELLELMEERGIKPHYDLAVLSFDNLEAYREAQQNGKPILTTIEKPRRQIGAEAVRMIVNNVTSREPMTVKTLLSSLIVRTSA